MLTDSKLLYPYFPVGFFLPNWIEENKSSELALEWRSALVSFFVKKEFHPQEAFLVGSGFLFLCAGKMPCIVTASHVITDMRKSGYSFISIDGVKFPFEHLEIFFNDEQDYALIPLTEKWPPGSPTVNCSLHVMMEAKSKPHRSLLWLTLPDTTNSIFNGQKKGCTRSI